MAHSLEVREPLMDHPLVEWLAACRPTQVARQEGKWLLKKAMAPRFPDEVLYRPKMGFAVPLAAGSVARCVSRVREAVLGERLAATDIFDLAIYAGWSTTISAGRATIALRCGRC